MAESAVVTPLSQINKSDLNSDIHTHTHVTGFFLSNNCFGIYHIPVAVKKLGERISNTTHSFY
jgi:hypothetical protein